MDGHPCEQLTEDQRVALRLTREGLTSKEIALHLGLKSKTAIDQRLDRARATLDAPDRKAAARIFAEWEAARDRIIRDPEQVVYRPHSIASLGSDEARFAGQANRIREEQAAYGRASPLSFPLKARLARTALGGRWNDLTIVQRLRWMAGSLLALVLSTFLLVAAYESLQRTLVELFIARS